MPDQRLLSRPIKATEGLVSSRHKIGRDNSLWSGIKWCPAEDEAQRGKIGSTVLLLAGELAGRVNEQISQFRLRFIRKAFQGSLEPDGFWWKVLVRTDFCDLGCEDL